MQPILSPSPHQQPIRSGSVGRVWHSSLTRFPTESTCSNSGVMGWCSMAMKSVFSTMQMVMAKSTKGSMTIKFTISFSFIQYGWHSQIRKVLANLYQQGGHFLWDSSSSAGTKQNRVQASPVRMKGHKAVDFVKMAVEVTPEKSWVKFVGRSDIRKEFFVARKGHPGSLHPWRGLRNDRMWHSVLPQHGDRSQVRLNDPGALFQPQGFWNWRILLSSWLLLCPHDTSTRHLHQVTTAAVPTLCSSPTRTSPCKLFQMKGCI